MTTRVHRASRSGVLGPAAVVAAVAGWSVTNTLVKVSDLPALTFAFWRLWIGAVVLVTATLVARRRVGWDIVRASAPGGVLLGLEIALFFSAIKRTSIVDVTMIAALQPALVLLVAGRMFNERVTGREVWLTLVSVGGVAVVAIGSAGTPAWSLTGDLLAVGSLLAWTGYFLVSKRVRREVNTLEYFTVVTVVAAMVVTPITLVSGVRIAVGQPEQWFLLGLFVVGATTGHLLVAWAQPYVDVSVSSQLMLAQPVFSAVAALVILDQQLTLGVVAGGAIVLGSLSMILRGRRRWDAIEDAPPQ
ncbi:MAG TPA: DMT family transporter [Actinomycetota bacterium]|nr:DMT family transporter [Actinomycetota bacterium]